MPVTLVCPNCDARLSAPETVLGKKVKCKKCDEPFVARRAAATDDDEDERPAKSSKVAKPRRDDDEDDERPRKSTKARQSVDEDDERPRKSTKARQPVDDDDEDRSARRSRDDEDDEEPRPRGKKTGKKKKKPAGPPVMLFVLIGGIALLLIAGGIGAYFAFIKEDKPADTPAAKGAGAKGPMVAAGGGPKVPGATWVDHIDAEAKYRIKFPAAPTAQTQQQVTPFGPITLKNWVCQSNGLAFVCNAIAVPPGGPDPEAMMDEAVKQASTQAPGATVSSSKKITHQGVSGREIVMTVPQAGSAVVRVFVTNNHVYTLGVVGPGATPDAANVVTFFELLKFDS